MTSLRAKGRHHEVSIPSSCTVDDTDRIPEAPETGENIVSLHRPSGPSSSVGALNVLSHSASNNPPAFGPYGERASLRYPSPLPGSQLPKSQGPIGTVPPPHTSMPHYGTQTLYHYQNPETGHLITSSLPPTHPAMTCLREGHHIPGPTHWGILGLLSAIVFFPVGVLCCLIDREVYCARCGEVIQSGLSA